MLRRFMDALKDFVFHKLTLRVLYIVAAFSTSHVLALLSSPQVQAFLSRIGVSVAITDPEIFKTWVTGSLLIGGEVVYHFVHNKLILPHVAPPAIGKGD